MRAPQPLPVVSRLAHPRQWQLSPSPAFPGPSTHWVLDHRCLLTHILSPSLIKRMVLSTIILRLRPEVGNVLCSALKLC